MVVGDDDDDDDDNPLGRRQHFRLDEEGGGTEVGRGGWGHDGIRSANHVVYPVPRGMYSDDAVDDDDDDDEDHYGV
jgi:hypothetical protein